MTQEETKLLAYDEIVRIAKSTVSRDYEGEGEIVVTGVDLKDETSSLPPLFIVDGHVKVTIPGKKHLFGKEPDVVKKKFFTLKIHALNGQLLGKQT